LPWKRCGPMASRWRRTCDGGYGTLPASWLFITEIAGLLAGRGLHKWPGLAHLWSQVPADNPRLCKAKSTFPLMTSGTISGILEAIQGEPIAPAWPGKGKVHETIFQQAFTRESGRRKALCCLRHIPPGRARGEAGLVVTVSAAVKRDRRVKPLLGLQPAPPGSAHRRRRQCARIGRLGASSTLCRLLQPVIKSDRQGKQQASILPHPWPLA
jgi:hypothetical protein